MLSLLLWCLFFKLNSFILYEQCFQTGSDSPTYYHSCIIQHYAFLDMLHCCGAVKFDQCTAILATSWGGEQVNTPAEWRLCQLLCTNIGLPHSRTEIPCRHVVDLSLACYNGLQSRNFFPNVDISSTVNQSKIHEMLLCRSFSSHVITRMTNETIEIKVIMTIVSIKGTSWSATCQ